MNTPAPDERGFLGLMAPEEKGMLFKLGRRLLVPRGAVLMYEGEPGERVMILLAGRVKVTRIADNGREVVLSICDPGDLLGELAYIDGDVRSCTVTALEQIEALAIPSSVFCAYVERTPRLAFALLEVLAKRFRETTVRNSEFRSDTLGRLAARLTELADRYGEPTEGGIEISLSLSQEELCAFTAASRAGVAKALQTLRKLGWIETRRRRIVVRNVEALRARAA
jgi:CRP-like cAMP-binding protein